MAKQDQIDQDALRIARAIASLRERHGVSQQLAADSHKPVISKQWWAKLESGRASGIFKPEVQRGMLAAINAASGLDTPLTIEDLNDEMSMPTPTKAEAREMRMARSFTAGPRTPQAMPRPASSAPAGGRQAVFPLSAGDAILQLPANMTPEAYEELNAYLTVFLQNHPRR